MRMTGIAAMTASVLLVGCGGGTADEAISSGDDTANNPANNPGSSSGAAAEQSDVPQAFLQCRTCHAVEPGEHRLGPSLAGVFNAKAGHVESFNYSSAMTESGLTWDAATLDAYLKAPREVVPGTTMAFAGVRDDAKRAELIEYLKTL